MAYRPHEINKQIYLAALPFETPFVKYNITYDFLWTRGLKYRMKRTRSGPGVGSICARSAFTPGILIKTSLRVARPLQPRPWLMRSYYVVTL